MLIINLGENHIMAGTLVDADLSVGGPDFCATLIKLIKNILHRSVLKNHKIKSYARSRTYLKSN